MTLVFPGSSTDPASCKCSYWCCNILTRSSSAQLMHNNKVVIVRDILEFMTTVVNLQVGILLLFQLALQPGVGLGLRYNMPPGLSVPCSISPFVYNHLSQVHGHVIQPSHSWSSSSSCCIQLSVQHLFLGDCRVLHSFYMQVGIRKL